MHVKTGLFSAAVLVAASMTEGHMIMTHPNPFGEGLNNSPLNGDGSDFPCKQRGAQTYQMTDGLLESNVFQIGSNTTLSFKGSATHGGGSCQISLTTDLEPTSSSKWSVIYSIEGGCPLNTDGNLAENPDSTGSTVFSFTIPEVQVGRYTLAWTWFNRIGNREMYMNCAPIEIISGSNGKRDSNMVKRSDEYPEMFVANINGCITEENIDIRFPNPGEFVQYAGNPTNLLPSGSPACTGAAMITGMNPVPSPTMTGTTVASAGGSSDPPPGNNPPDATTTAAGNEQTNSGGVPHQSTTATTAAAAPQETNAPENQPIGTSPSSGALTGACTPEGQWNCIGGTSFQRCASGLWSVTEPVAAGTFCSPGQSADLTIAAGHVAKREHVAGIHRRRVSHAHHHVVV
ncbi:hypothetical protein PISL3812_04451 [Talaromyces islandicus]|uniref:Lytic polysaccharide monooxygenase n=1 Tax=Talaromyces islandicus TaxID=28573 RepID=A0A0U1LVK2_TALIS|nr:hypothetical protein PISL3812_04451 [Talaromyces islandicus]